MNESRRYCLITPCRNEAAFAAQTIESVCSQSILPALWVIVDDGSSDETPRILAEYAENHSFIRIVTRRDRGRREVGGGVIEAFNEGLATINLDEFDYLCKLDLDLVLPSNYFELLMGRMNANPRIGTCSGKPYFLTQSGKACEEVCGDENSVGMTKFYRTACFKDIGGFVSEVMWDGIDCHRCRLLGWIAVSWNDPALKFLHLRPMGSSYKSIWAGRMRHGRGQYFMGSSAVYILASALYRLRARPRVLGSLAMLTGYFGAMLCRAPRYQDQVFVTELRKHQLQSLLVGKKRAYRQIDQANDRKWQNLKNTSDGSPSPKTFYPEAV